MTADLVILKNLLEFHDSKYMMSDDKEVYNKGKEENNIISSLCAELFLKSPDKVNELWFKHYGKEYGKVEIKKGENMNIYEKLQNCRCELQNLRLKKSGQNKFAGYWYYELGDFLPAINNLFLKHKLCSFITFTDLQATLHIIDSEKPETDLIFTSPMRNSVLKGCNEIQNLGAIETYQRRYLYMTALEIIEHDPNEAVTGKEPLPESKKPLVDTNRPSPDFQEPQATQKAPEQPSPSNDAEIIEEGLLLNVIEKTGQKGIYHKIEWDTVDGMTHNANIFDKKLGEWCKELKDNKVVIAYVINGKFKNILSVEALKE